MSEASSQKPEKKPAETIAAYPWSTPITTRWMDNDVYGHVNNVVYYSYFDTAANLYLVREGGLDIHGGGVIGVVVESKCEYREAVAFPETLVAGVRVDKLGNRSVTYGIGIFRNDDDATRGACASGHFVHVFVDRTTRTPVPIPDRIREALARIAVRP